MICIILGIRQTQIQHFLHSDTITINTTSTINSHNNTINTNSSNHNNNSNHNKRSHSINNHHSQMADTGEDGSVTPPGTEGRGEEVEAVDGVKVKQSTMATGLTVTSLTVTSLTGRAIKVIGMVTRVTAEVTAVRESEDSRGGTDITVPAGNQLNTRSTGWLAAVFNPMVKPSMLEVLEVVEVVVTREGWAAGRAAGQASW